MGFWDWLVIILTKLISFASKTFGFGAGETWPGEIALKLRPDIARSLAASLPEGVILIAGTNGKTTTSLMAKTILGHIGYSVVHNSSGANLVNGIVSSCIRNTDWLGRVTSDIGIFEIDENSLPILLRYIVPKQIILLNLFRDQLDRYGEVDVIVEKWERALKSLPKSTSFIINSDDPGIAHIGSQVRGHVTYFGLDDPNLFQSVKDHAMDSAFCPACGSRLSYKGVYYSHIGVWYCPSCKLKRPVPTVSSYHGALPGLYNRYNTLAAVALAKSLDITDKEIHKSLAGFVPAFGRQEDITLGGKHIKIFLSKNPAGFNASLRTVLEMHAETVLFVLNDRIPDGRDVSWIWDVDFEMIPSSVRIFVSGDRVYDLALRIKYADSASATDHIQPHLSQAIRAALARTGVGQTLFILATYSAMLDVRKIVKGRKIL